MPTFAIRRQFRHYIPGAGANTAVNIRQAGPKLQPRMKKDRTNHPKAEDVSIVNYTSSAIYTNVGGTR